MAHAIDFPERNGYFGKPQNMTENQCYALPVCHLITHIPGETDNEPAVKYNAHVSCWELSAEELEEVKRTGKVYLKVLGRQMVPVSIHGIKPIYINEGELSDILLKPKPVEA